VRLSIRRSRRALGRLLDALTIIDHLFSKKEHLLRSTEIEADLLHRIRKSPTVLIYGSYFADKSEGEKEELFLDNLEKDWPVMRMANSAVVEAKSGWLIRANRGRDLALFRETLEVFDCELSDKNILWFNSSCNWDLVLLRKCIYDLENSTFSGVTSLTDNWLGGYHLQTYFLFFNKEVSLTVSRVIVDTFSRNWNWKRTLIHRGERRLTSNFHLAGVKTKVLFPAKTLNPKNYKWENIYIHNADVLDKLSVPGRKIKTLK